MEDDVITARGDGVGKVFIRDGSGSARITILAERRTSQESELPLASSTKTRLRTLQSVTVELAGQSSDATSTPVGDNIATFSASIDVSAVEGALPGRVVARGKQTDTTTPEVGDSRERTVAT